MKKNQLIIYSCSIGIFLYLLALAVYIIYMQNLSISNSTELWGQFGSFIGGVISPLMIIVNIIVLIFITKLSHDLQISSNIINVTIQNKIMINQLRQNVYENLIKNVNIVYEFLAKGIKNRDIASVYPNLQPIQLYIRYFADNMNHLFPKSRIENYVTLCDDLAEIMFKLSKNYDDINNRQNDDNLQEFVDNHNNFNNEYLQISGILLNKLRDFICSELVVDEELKKYNSF